MQKKNRILIVVISVFLIPNSVNAQDQHLEKKCFICKKSGTHHVHEPPYKDFSFKSEFPILAGAVGLTLTTQLLKSPNPLTKIEINALDKNNINGFDRYATSQNSTSAQKVSDVFLTGVLVLPALFISNHHTRKDLIPLVTMSAEVIIVNYALTDIVKKLAKRTRPLAYNPNFSLEEKMKESAKVSFFSGHTSHTAALSFFIAKVIDDYHPDAKKGIRIGLWTFAAAVPAVTGYLRVKAGKHFPTDTITGFIVGGLVGVLVPHFHKKRQNSTNKKITFTPTFGVGMASLNVIF